MTAAVCCPDSGVRLLAEVALVQVEAVREALVVVRLLAVQGAVLNKTPLRKQPTLQRSVGDSVNNVGVSDCIDGRGRRHAFAGRQVAVARLDGHKAHVFPGELASVGGVVVQHRHAEFNDAVVHQLQAVERATR